MTSGEAAIAGLGSQVDAVQVQVLAFLLEGRSITESAAAAGVDRTTVHRWLKDDFNFRAGFNRGKKQLQAETETRLMQVAQRAADALGRAIDEGNVTASIAVLKGLGLLSGAGISLGSDDPQLLSMEEATEHENAAMRIALSRL